MGMNGYDFPFSEDQRILTVFTGCHDTGEYENNAMCLEIVLYCEMTFDIKIPGKPPQRL
jgi:hypothetical protein